MSGPGTRPLQPRPYERASLVRNFRAAVVGEGVSKGAAFLAVVLVARSLSAEDFGRFSFVVAIVSVGLLFADVGLQVAATRAIAADRPRAAEYFGASLLLGASVAVATYSLLAGAVALQLLPDDVGPAVAVFGLVLVLTAGINAYAAILRGFERQDLIYAAYAISSVALLVPIAVAGARGAAVESLLGLYVASFALRLVLTFAFANAKVMRLGWRPTRRAVRALAVSAPLAALAYALQGVYSHIDLVLLGFLVAAADVGHYAEAYRLVDGVTFLTAGALTAAVFPVFARLARDAPAETARLYGVTVRLAAAGMTPASLILVAAAGPLVGLVYGGDSAASAHLFALLAPSTALIALNFLTIYVALAVGQERVAIASTGAAAVLNITTNLVAVPLYGVDAAAAATFVGEVVMLCLFQLLLPRDVFGKRQRASVVAAVVTGAAVAATLAVPGARVGIGVAGAAVAVVALSVTGAIDADDVRRIAHMVGIARPRRRGGPG